MSDFRHRAACRDVDPELFFPSGPGPLGQEQARRAKAVCHRCSVTAPCLEWAMDHGLQDGIWGGMDADDRRALRRRRLEAAARR